VDGWFAGAVEDPEGVADLTERPGEQVVGVGEPAVAQEQVAHGLAQVGVVDASVRLGLSDRGEGLDGVGGLFVEGARFVL
jgi:hypothetical protein